MIVLTELKVDRAQQRNHPSPALRQHVLLTTTRGFDCLHPLDPQRIVTIGYSERRVSGTPSLLVRGQLAGEEGEAFVQSIRFTPRR